MSVNSRRTKLTTNYVLKLKPCLTNPAYGCALNHQTQNSLKILIWLLLAFEVYHCLMIQELTWMFDDTTVSDTPPVSQSEPHICLSLTNKNKTKKDSTNSEVHKTTLSEVTSKQQCSDIYRRLKMSMKRLLLQQCHALPRIAPAQVGWAITILFTKRSCKQSLFLLDKYINLKNINSWFFFFFSDSLSAFKR